MMVAKVKTQKAPKGRDSEKPAAKERPILFSTEMVKAILEGNKTQTRRVIKNTDGSPIDENDISWSVLADGEYSDSHVDYVMDFSKTYPYWKENKCPYGKPGDLLYVRETWKPLGQNADDGEWSIEYKTGEKLRIGRLWPSEQEEKEIDFSERLAEQYENKGYMPWKPSIHMPKAASRIWLKVNDVRVERVQDISLQEIEFEGIDIPTYQDSYGYGQRLKQEWINLWDSINAKRENGQFAWDANPWVWVVDFEVLSTAGKPEDV